LAKIGGYVGLLLGAALVNIVNINSFLLDVCFNDKQKTTKLEKNVKDIIEYPMKRFVIDDKKTEDGMVNTVLHLKALHVQYYK
jgi:hypothetical protein